MKLERILVTGGRNYDDQAMLFGALDMQAEQAPIHAVIQGGASGADLLARMWCYTRGIRCDNYPAEWTLHGKAAGPRRNQQMIDDGQPTMVFAFPGGRGTADMVRRAEAAGVPVHYFGREP